MKMDEVPPVTPEHGGVAPELDDTHVYIPNSMVQPHREGKSGGILVYWNGEDGKWSFWPVPNGYVPAPQNDMGRADGLGGDPEAGVLGCDHEARPGRTMTVVSGDQKMLLEIAVGYERHTGCDKDVRQVGARQRVNYLLDLAGRIGVALDR